MKKILLSVLFVFSLTGLFAQEKSKNVPSNVKSAFEKKFPRITPTEWEKEGNYYEAEYKVDGKQHSTVHTAVFDANGTYIETEQEIRVNELPSGVKTYVSSKYPGKKITEASKITDAKGTIFYEAETDGKDLIFDANGNFVKSEADDEEEDDDDKDDK